MIDVCTVVFEEELPILKIQAASIDLHCQNIGIRNIYVVLNDAETLAEQIDPTWWGTLSERVLVIPRSAFSAPWDNNGWLTQQLWKMLVASMSYNVYTMVLDAKTVFVRELTPAELFTAAGQLTLGQLPVYPVFEPAREICNRLFDIDLQNQAGPGGVPFFFHNDTVRLMIAEVTKRTNTTFALWFQQQGCMTEFMLYSAFCQWQYGSLDALYARENTLGQIVNVCHSQVPEFDSLLKLMQQDRTLTVSVHRNAWSNLNEEQRNNYRMLLIDRNLYTAYGLK